MRKQIHPVGDSDDDKRWVSVSLLGLHIIIDPYATDIYNLFPAYPVPLLSAQWVIQGPAWKLLALSIWVI